MCNVFKVVYGNKREHTKYVQYKLTGIINDVP